MLDELTNWASVVLQSKFLDLKYHMLEAESLNSKDVGQAYPNIEDV